VTRFIALFVALVAGVGVAVWYYRAPVDGMPAAIVRNDDRWMEGLQSRAPKQVEEATAQLEERGTAALPVIRRTLQDAAAEPGDKQAALKATAILGVRAAEALPDVAAVLHEPDFAPEAALALSFMGSPAVPALQDAVNSNNEIVRREALRALGKLRERASIDPKLVVPLLLRAVDDPDPTVRHVAVTYLGIVRDEPAAAVKGLIEALADESPEVRQAAAAALAEYGAAAERAIPALKKAAGDADEDVRREAGRTLVHLSEIKKEPSR
jgi:HEAT repeat protein